MYMLRMLAREIDVELENDAPKGEGKKHEIGGVKAIV